MRGQVYLRNFNIQLKWTLRELNQNHMLSYLEEGIQEMSYGQISK